MCHPKGYGFLAFFGLETGKNFAHYDLKPGMIFEPFWSENGYYLKSGMVFKENHAS